MTTPWHESVEPDEEARFNGYAAELRALQRSRAKGGVTPRGLHAKQHVGVVGKLVVGTPPPPFRVAVFEAPATWPVYVRYSNGVGERQHDGVADIRGVAIKLVGVPGRKIIPGLEDKVTQDFLFIQTPAVATGTPEAFMALVRAAAKGKALLLPRLIGALGFVGAFRVLKAFATMPKVASMATGTFYAPVPVRYGDTAAKLALFPKASDPPRGAGGPNALRDDLVARLKAGPVTYSLRVQLFLDEATTPIEDASVVWPQDKTPFVEVGELILAQQDVSSTRGQEIDATVDGLSFDPWHAVEALRPLGGIMRARASAYRESVVERGAAPEPTTVLDPTP